MAQITLKGQTNNTNKTKNKKERKGGLHYVNYKIIKERMVEFEVETRDWCDA
jgi:hypothetical protein